VAITRDLSRTFAARSAPVSAAGGGGAVLVLHEITDLRRADQVRRDFVANVSHELRTPLTAIRGYVEALLDEPTMADDARGFLEIVARHSARMERLVTDLLRLARLDARQELLDMAPCDVPQLLRGVVDDQRPGLDAKHQHVVIDVAPEAATVPADPAKLHDIVRNLVENAINYSPDRTEIRRVRVGRHRHRPRYSPRRPGARVRAVLPGGQITRAAGRHRPGSRHRQAPD
jgi:two-component system phosphate regulon sensor histidine kinase PhoR